MLNVAGVAIDDVLVVEEPLGRWRRTLSQSTRFGQIQACQMDPRPSLFEPLEQFDAPPADAGPPAGPVRSARHAPESAPPRADSRGSPLLRRDSPASDAGRISRAGSRRFLAAPPREHAAFRSASGESGRSPRTRAIARDSRAAFVPRRTAIVESTRRRRGSRRIRRQGPGSGRRGRPPGIDPGQ